MPLPAINLVCTRCTDGDHAALQRWYNDHAQLLMASDKLQAAHLFRLQPEAGDAPVPDYCCLYELACLADFAAFDSGEVMAEVRDLSQAATGRSSIEIVKRTQYERMLHRRWAPEGQLEGSFHVSLLQREAGSPEHISRWLTDVLHQLHGQWSGEEGVEAGRGLHSAQVYASPYAASAQELLVVLHLDAGCGLPANWHALSSPYAPTPVLRKLWSAPAQRLTQWLR